MAIPGVEGSIFSTEGSLSDKIVELFVGQLPRRKLLDDLGGLLPARSSSLFQSRPPLRRRRHCRILLPRIQVLRFITDYDDGRRLLPPHQTRQQ